MSSIAITPINMFKSFEKAMRTQLETQESEMRADLKDREAEMRGMQENLESMKTQKTMNDRIVEELRPLCEELPADALDPVTFEPLDEPMLTACTHTFNRSTVTRLIDSIGGYETVKNLKGVPCPICRWKFAPKTQFFPNACAFGMTNTLKKISEVFKKHVK